ncbi:DinB family protein [Flavivirga eckloniae]|uniref:DNA damage-inducible protein DinB n=1 Tax=Flavivirga eckloniae TaxID=1803846 RepID=A0A2K9PUR2_9FLAO|nr:DinB family protein [Flavivirga eckloniae]AUP80277.1 DNA damage-inducible protein DinB [Flavivirga eckloniae]
MNNIIEFPSASEYPSYAEMYMKWVKKDGNLIKQLEDSLQKTKKLISTLPEDTLNFRYKKNKWSIKEILVHIIDDERIYAYRALAFARNDKTNLPGFEQDNYINNAYASERSIDNIMEEYEAIRKSTIALYDGFSNKVLTRQGIANGNLASVRALGYHILGHELHHINVIEALYLKAFK